MNVGYTNSTDYLCGLQGEVRVLPVLSLQTHNDHIYLSKFMWNVIIIFVVHIIILETIIMPVTPAYNIPIPKKFTVSLSFNFLGNAFWLQNPRDSRDHNGN